MEVNESQPLGEKLRLTTKLAYGAGDVSAAITANILVFYLLPFLTNVAGMQAGLAGSVLMIGKISDAINDPIVGMMSDRTRSIWGRRIPWMLYGAMPFALIYLLQWLVPPVNQWLLFLYYTFIGVIFNIFYTVVNLPYTTLTPELTRDYDESTSLNSIRFAFSIGASILSLLIALAVFKTYPNEPYKQYLYLGLSCSLISFLTLMWCVLRIQERGAQPVLSYSQRRKVGKILPIVSGVLLVLGGIMIVAVDSFWGINLLLISILGMVSSFTFKDSQPETHLSQNNTSEPQDSQSMPLKEQLRIAFSNKPFLYVIGIYLCSWLAVQLTASILVYFVVSWIGVKESDSPFVALSVQGTALVLLFGWQKLSDRLGKKTVYCLGMSLWIIAEIGLFSLQPGQVTGMYIMAIMAGCGVSVAYLIPWSMIPDVIDLDELNTGQRREGVFYSFMVLLQKFGLALGLFVVGIVLEAAGFIQSVPNSPLPQQPESALFAIRIAVGPLPAFFLIIGSILAYFYPITRELHDEIRLKLIERKQSI